MTEYQSHAFDCDGVLLESNGLKSRAFYQAALPYGEDAATKMMEYHQRAGSISRRQRWEDFFRVILMRAPEDGEVDRVLSVCTGFVRDSILHAPKMRGIENYLRFCTARKIVVSSVEDSELKGILDEHDLTKHFDVVFGSRNGQLKSELLISLVLSGVILPPAVYYGDALDDYMAASKAHMDFVFVSGCTEFKEWREFFANKPVKIIENFTEATALLSA